MKKVILTGANGLIGKEVILPLLKSGAKVFALVRDKNINTLPTSENSIKYIECDLFDYKKIEKIFEDIKPTHLLHFAWYTGNNYLTSDINYKLLDASLYMLEYFKNSGGERAIFTGTCFEYRFKDSLLKETDEINPTTIYAKCKNELRVLAEIYCKQNNISFGWGRIFYVFGHGENEKRLFPSVINALKNNEKIVIKSGRLIRDYMCSIDIADAFVVFLFSDYIGIVNICSGKTITIKDFVLAIVKHYDKIELVEFIDDCTDQPPIIVGDNEKLRNKIGFMSQYNLHKIFDNIINKRF